MNGSTFYHSLFYFSGQLRKLTLIRISLKKRQQMCCTVYDWLQYKNVEKILSWKCYSHLKTAGTFHRALEIPSRKTSRGNGLTYVLYDLKIFFSKGNERLELQERSSEKGKKKKEKKLFCKIFNLVKNSTIKPASHYVSSSRGLLSAVVLMIAPAVDVNPKGEEQRLVAGIVWCKVQTFFMDRTKGNT